MSAINLILLAKIVETFDLFCTMQMLARNSQYQTYIVEDNTTSNESRKKCILDRTDHKTNIQENYKKLHAQMHVLLATLVIDQKLDIKKITADLKSNEELNVAMQRIVKNSNNGQDMQFVVDGFWAVLENDLHDIVFINKTWFEYFRTLADKKIYDEANCNNINKKACQEVVKFAECKNFMDRNDYDLKLSMTKFGWQMRWFYNDKIPEGIVAISGDLVIALEEMLICCILYQISDKEKSLWIENIESLCNSLRLYYENNLSYMLSSTVYAMELLKLEHQYMCKSSTESKEKSDIFRELYNILLAKLIPVVNCCNIIFNVLKNDMVCGFRELDELIITLDNTLSHLDIDSRKDVVAYILNEKIATYLNDNPEYVEHVKCLIRPTIKQCMDDFYPAVKQQNVNRYALY